MGHARSVSPIEIAGAGPAGLACAIALAQRGLPAVVHEQRAQIGGRFHGGFQILPCFGDAPHGFELLARFGLMPGDLDALPLRAARLLDKDGRSSTVTSAEPYALLLRRGPQAGTLDGALAARARALGVTLRAGSRLDPAHAHVMATGPASVDGLAQECLFETDAADRTDVLFDDRITPGGYGYLMIRGGQGTLGVAVVSGFRALQAMLDLTRDRFAAHQPFSLGAPRVFRHPMSFALPTSAVDERRLHVGEAGGFQDDLFGLGLRPALVSGEAAAEALAEVGGALANAAPVFVGRWQRALKRRMEASLVDRYLFEHAPSGSDRIALRLARGDLRGALDRLTGAGPAQRFLLPWVRWRWGARAGAADARCAHRMGAHWCRARGPELAALAVKDVEELLVAAQEHAR